MFHFIQICFVHISFLALIVKLLALKINNHVSSCSFFSHVVHLVFQELLLQAQEMKNSKEVLLTEVNFQNVVLCFCSMSTLNRNDRVKMVS